MNRPATSIGIILKEHSDIVTIELVGRQNAVCAVDLKQGDRDHQGAGELEGGVLGKGKVVRHDEGSIGERVNSRSMAPPMGRGRSRSPRRRRRERRHVHVADPASGLIVEDPEPDQETSQKSGIDLLPGGAAVPERTVSPGSRCHTAPDGPCRAVSRRDAVYVRPLRRSSSSTIACTVAKFISARDEISNIDDRQSNSRQRRASAPMPKACDYGERSKLASLH